MKPRALLGFVVVCMLASVTFAVWPQGAQAQDDTWRPRLSLRAAMGFAGEVKFSLDADDDSELTQDLEPTWGGVAGLDIPLLPFLSIGGELGVHTWNSEAAADANTDRSVLVDVAAVPRLRIPFGGAVAHGALFLGVPIGLAINVLDDQYQDVAAVFGSDISTGSGGIVGIRAGAQFFFTSGFGLTALVGYVARVVRHRFDSPAGDDHFRLTFHQMTVQAGLVFGL